MEVTKNMKKNTTTRILACAAAWALLATGCSSNQPSTSGAAPSEQMQAAPETTAAGQEAPTKIDMIIGYDGVEFPQPDNVVQAKIEEYTNTKLNITAYPGSTLHEMLPTMIASDELPMVVSFGGSQLSKTYMINAMKQGVFWDLTDYIDQFPNISQISDITYTAISIDGRIYGLPKERGLARDAVGYRYDWIENLGLEEPKTVDDLYNLMLAFTKDDPDGNGVDDTYGCSINPLSWLNVFSGGPNGWRYENGEMILAQFTEEHQKALDMVRSLYEQGALHPEYAIHTRSQIEALWTEGKAGMYFNINNFAQFSMEQPEAVVHANGVFSCDKGTFAPAGSGHNGILAISKKAVPDEESLLKILSFFDSLGDGEMCNLLVLGIEGEHYNVVDGMAVPVAEKSEEVGQQIYLPYAAPIAVAYPDFRTMPVKRDYLQTRTIEILEENLPYAVANPTTGLISETFNEIGSELNTILNDASTQYIMGKISKEQYLEQLQLWKDRGGEKIAHEFAAAYKERQGK